MATETLSTGTEQEGYYVEFVDLKTDNVVSAFVEGPIEDAMEFADDLMTDENDQVAVITQS